MTFSDLVMRPFPYATKVFSSPNTPAFLLIWLINRYENSNKSYLPLFSTNDVTPVTCRKLSRSNRYGQTSAASSPSCRSICSKMRVKPADRLCVQAWSNGAPVYTSKCPQFGSITSFFGSPATSWRLSTFLRRRDAVQSRLQSTTSGRGAILSTTHSG